MTYLRYPIEHYDQYQHPAVRPSRPTCHVCGSPAIGGTFGARAWCVDCVPPLARLVDMREPCDLTRLPSARDALLDQRSSR